MDNTQQEQLFGLLAVAEEQRQAVEAAVAGLATERAALAQERAALAQAAASVADVAGQMRRATAEVVPAIQKAAGDATSAAVRQSLAGAAQTAASALGEATRPVIGSLSGVVKAASDAEDSMRSAGAWFAWKWVRLHVQWSFADRDRCCSHRAPAVGATAVLRGRRAPDLLQRGRQLCNQSRHRKRLPLE